MYRKAPTKSIVFKAIYLAVSLSVAGFTIYLLADYIVYGFKNGVSFDDCIALITLTVLLLFECSVIGFIIRSFNAPTLLMKNLVFKNDGKPYVPGIALTAAGALIFGALATLFLISAYGKTLFDINLRAQSLVAAIGLTLFVNLIFTDAYFLTFRHESGTFAII